ncbi:MAG: divergent PAP2 family protein [Oscillospiraceae bacterium]|nr:divergent PAP2 family protein [Oscillospiraceae bacterium]MBR3611484.1 divergent PAP2 family protein [Oscillospiraceae bacterium]MBR3952321.1 divergent PAP2 family protein [Oscillospiraceae bacterium]
MDWLFDFITNKFFITAVVSWTVAQVLKVIIHAIINKTWDFERLFGDGGMPSGHSATVSSLATISALTYGFGSFEFAVTAILAIIVCHDAMGVRLEAGKHAKLLNILVDSFEKFSKKELPEVVLKEFVGHTPLQVITGIILGILCAFAMHFVFFA